MTATVVMHLGDCVLIAADTRTTMGQPAIRYDDSTIKVRASGIGLITGCGYVPLLEEVKDFFCDGKFQHTGQLQDHIRARMRWRETFDPVYRTDFARFTTWFATYEAPTDEGQKVRLVCFPASAPAWNVQPGTGALQLPHDADPEVTAALNNQLTESIRPFDDFHDFQPFLRHHIEAARVLLREAAERYVTCGPRFSVGLHLRGGDAFVLPPADTRGPAKH